MSFKSWNSVCRSSIRFVPGILLIIVTGGWHSRLNADPPVVGFDAHYVVACREVLREDSNGHKVIEATFKVSALLAQGKTEDLDTIVYRITHGSRDAGVSAVDHIPKTTLYSEVAEPIVVIETKKASFEGTADVSAAYKVVAHGTVLGQASSESRVEYKKLPPKKVLVASGTIDRGSGVFFRLAASNYATLEGQEEFSVLFRVPGNWQAGAVTVRCEAHGYQRRIWPLGDRTVVCGLAEFGVGLYLDGNPSAEQAAREFADAQHAFLDEIVSTGNEKTVWGWVWAIAKYWFIRQLADGQLGVASNALLIERLLESPGQEAQLPANTLAKLNDMRRARSKLEALSQ